MMFKFSIAIWCSILISHSVNAETEFSEHNNKSWQYSEWKEWAISPEVYDINDPKNSYVVSYATVGGVVTVAVLTKDHSCHGFSERIRPHKVIRYNGQAVRTSLQCYGNSRALIFPSSSAGTKFIIDEFTYKNNVKIEGYKKFSAKGFSRTLSLVKKQARRNAPL
ncbi:hypothetical protein BCT62_17120 [Vibrio splendidus]|nr:hypothetical protein BCT62_17120 [Vibrio splendidus]